MNRLFATTALITALAMTPALAEGQKMPRGNEAQTQQLGDQQQAMRTDDVQFVDIQQNTDWLASSLIGRTVYNNNEEGIGDINDVIISESGQVVAVVIGVGGFLGIGEKDVGVDFAALSFKPSDDTMAGDRVSATDRQPASGRESAGGGYGTDDRNPTGQTDAGTNRQAAGELQDDRTAGDDNTAARQPASDSDRGMLDTRRMALGDDADHSRMIIVLNTTKEELEAAPAFVYLDEQDSGETQPQAAPEENERESN